MSLEECKQAITECINALIADGTRKANIEIELIHHIRRELYER